MNKAEGISSAFSSINASKHPLAKHIPISVIAEFESLQKFGIDTNLRLCHFLAQCAHESNNFKTKVENLNYSEAALKSVFGKYFPDNLAAKFARQPEKIANRVYANRMGNGDEASGDGWKYRGRGFIMTTGKNNYKAFSDFAKVDAVSQPNLISEKYSLQSGAFFWMKNNISKIADEGSSDEVVKKITKVINGGYNGLHDRTEYFKKFIKIV